VCIYIHLNVYTYIHIYIFVYTDIYVFMYTHIYAHVCVELRDIMRCVAAVFVAAGACIFTYLHVYTCIHMYIFVYTYIYIYTYIHMYAHVRVQSCEIVWCVAAVFVAAGVCIYIHLYA